MQLPTSQYIFNKDFCKGTTPIILQSIKNYKNSLINPADIKIYDFEAMRNFNEGLFIDLTKEIVLMPINTEDPILPLTPINTIIPTTEDPVIEPVALIL